LVLLLETRWPTSACAVTRVDILISTLWGLFRGLPAARPSRGTPLLFADVVLFFYAKLSAFEFFHRLNRGLGGLGGDLEELGTDTRARSRELVTVTGVKPPHVVLGTLFTTCWRYASRE
jgi:hypothetical protein